jgi:hypothetical protein
MFGPFAPAPYTLHPSMNASPFALAARSAIASLLAIGVVTCLHAQAPAQQGAAPADKRQALKGEGAVRNKAPHPRSRQKP